MHDFYISFLIVLAYHTQTPCPIFGTFVASPTVSRIHGHAKSTGYELLRIKLIFHQYFNDVHDMSNMDMVLHHFHLCNNILVPRVFYGRPSENKITFSQIAIPISLLLHCRTISKYNFSMHHSELYMMVEWYQANYK